MRDRESNLGQPFKMIEEILEKWRKGTTGPLPQLNRSQLLNSLVLIDREGPVGRRTLAQALRINDGIARGLLERLAEQGIVTVGETGVKLSDDGKARMRSLLQGLSIKKIQGLEKSEFVPGKVVVGIHVSQGYRVGLTGIPQRDEAVKAGANGSITIAMKNGRLIIPPDNKDAEELSPMENSRLRTMFRTTDNDLIIIGFGSDRHLAMAGALAAVTSTIPRPDIVP